MQTTEAQGVKGFIIRTEVTDPDEAAGEAAAVAVAVKLPPASFQVTTIGPGWGANITNRALMALGLSLAAILLYISVRFEYKMSVTAVVALVHDILITLGIYALLGYEVTPNTIAALLTILGDSLTTRSWSSTASRRTRSTWPSSRSCRWPTIDQRGLRALA